MLLRVTDPGLDIGGHFVYLALSKALALNLPMNPEKPRLRSRPPHNPGLRDLIQGKRKWSQAPNIEDVKRGFQGWHERGYLPHRDEPGLTQFVTFRLADSFPESLRSEWEHFAKLEDHREKRKQLEEYLDRGRGECHLRRPEIANLVENNFRKFSGRKSLSPSHASDDRLRYELRAWVIMPNHIHILFKVGSVSMSETVGAWKRHTGRLANELLEKRGEFWAEDYFDTYIRDAEHEQKTMRYIESNPAKARLVLDPRDWSWSSARFRDEFGALKL
jgi:REP element-mobilizing transposase RayT